MSRFTAGIVAAVFLLAGETFAAPMGTAFTYQGHLTDGGSPANGPYDFQFRLCSSDACDDPEDPIGVVPIENHPVTNGLFTVDLDFGDGAFNGNARWLEIGVRPGPATDPDPYEILDPRQKLTPTPHALALPGLWTQQNATSPNLIGGYNHNSITPGAAGATISGGGMDANPDDGRCTDDPEILCASDFDCPTGTCVPDGAVGRCLGNPEILCLDAQDCPPEDVCGVLGINRVTGDYGTVAGGSSNEAGSWDTVGGGRGNTASGALSTVAGGWNNEATGWASVICGGNNNI